MDIEAAYNQVSSAIEAGRAAHGYIIVGAVRGAALELSQRILKDIFDSHVEDRANPDIHWLLPEGKKRIIPIDSMRERMIEMLTEPSRYPPTTIKINFNTSIDIPWLLWLVRVLYFHRSDNSSFWNNR